MNPLVGAHSLTLVDRSRPHVHRWLPSCCCGWTGIPLRRRTSAEQSYRNHVRHAERVVRAERRVRPAMTALDQERLSLGGTR